MHVIKNALSKVRHLGCKTQRGIRYSIIATEDGSSKWKLSLEAKLRNVSWTFDAGEFFKEFRTEAAFKNLCRAPQLTFDARGAMSGKPIRLTLKVNTFQSEMSLTREQLRFIIKVR